MTIILAVPTYAAAPITTNKDQANEMASIEKLANKYGFNVVDINKDQGTVQCKSLTDLENNLKTIKNEDDSENHQSTVMLNVSNNGTANNLVTASSNTNLLAAASSSKIQTVTLFSFYNPFAGFDGLTLLTWSNVFEKYTYTMSNGHPVIISLDECNSYETGVNTCSWVQTGYLGVCKTTNTYHDTLHTTVYGRYILGVSINGFTVGLSRNSTWLTNVVLY